MAERLRAVRTYFSRPKAWSERCPDRCEGMCGICRSDNHIVYEGVTPVAYPTITPDHEPSRVKAP